MHDSHSRQKNKYLRRNETEECNEQRKNSKPSKDYNWSREFKKGSEKRLCWKKRIFLAVYFFTSPLIVFCTVWSLMLLPSQSKKSANQNLPRILSRKQGTYATQVGYSKRHSLFTGLTIHRTVYFATLRSLSEQVTMNSMKKKNALSILRVVAIFPLVHLKG